jgi:hypothetical protein
LGLLQQTKELKILLNQIENDFFDSNKLSESIEEVEENFPEKTFDIQQFELKLNELANNFNTKTNLNKLIESFKTTLLTINELDSSIELVA